MSGSLAVIRGSGEWSFCEATVKYDSESRLLTACDRYGCSEVEAPPPLVVLPAPPILRPFTLTQVVYVEFERRVFVEKGDQVWATVPLDIEVVKRGRPVARLATSKAKYRLVGSLVEGIVARNARSPALREPVEPPECSALVRIDVQKGVDAVEGIPFNAGHSVIYRGPHGLYLSVVTAVITQATIDTRTTRDPPVEGAKPVRGPPYGHPGRITTLTTTAVTVERGWRLWPYLRT